MFKIRLKALREGKGMTQRDFATDFGVSKGTVGMWESGAREPRTLDELNRIADYFGVSSDYLLGRTEEKEKPAPINEDGLSETARQIMDCVSQMSLREQEAFLAWLQASQERS